MIQDLNRFFDRKNTASLLSNVFRRRCHTEKPLSHGIQIEGVYLDENYSSAPSQPGNDCCFGVNYALNYNEIPRETEDFFFKVS